VHVDGRFASLLDDLETLESPIYAAVEARSSEAIVEATQELRAAPMPQQISRLVGVEDGAWALIVTRRYVGADGATMVCSLNWHPAERFSYKMRLQRS
jgi:GntR family transcriptional regulator